MRRGHLRALAPLGVVFVLAACAKSDGEREAVKVADSICRAVLDLEGLDGIELVAAVPVDAGPDSQIAQLRSIVRR